jgi:hypothetical protein
MVRAESHDRHLQKFFKGQTRVAVAVIPGRNGGGRGRRGRERNRGGEWWRKGG